MDLIGDLLAFMWVAVLINTLGVKASTPAGGSGLCVSPLVTGAPSVWEPFPLVQGVWLPALAAPPPPGRLLAA